MVNSSEKDTNRSYYDLNTRKPTMMRNRSRSEHASRTCLPSVLAEEAFYVRHFRYRKRSHSADSAYFDWENRVSPIDSNMYCNGAQLSQDPSSPTQTLFPSEIPMANRITLGLQSVLPGSSAGKLDLHAFIFECFPSKPVDTSKNSLTKYMEEIREYITGNRESSSDHFDLAGDLTSLHEDEKVSND